MKYLVFSDTHRYIKNAENVIRSFEKDIDGFIHLGDVCDDAEQLHTLFPKLKYYSVSGNNDYGEKAPNMRLAFAGGKKIVLTHGHKQRVSYGLIYLDYFARQEEADAVLFGHTHIPCLEYSGNMPMFNPGSISLPRSTYEPTFGMMTVEDGNISFDAYIYKGVGDYEKIKI